jgi:hypothetical protein
MEDEMNGITPPNNGTGTPADRLEEIARCCLAGKPLDPRHSDWLAHGINSFLDEPTLSLEEALGLRYGRGGVPWWRERAIRERDAALRKLADGCGAGLSICQRSKEIETLARRYGASAWLRDRKCQEMPASYAGTPRELLWRAFRSGATMPLSERQVRNIISA